MRRSRLTPWQILRLHLGQAGGLSDWAEFTAYLCARLRFAAVCRKASCGFGAQGADERIKEERQNRQPAYSQKYPAIKTHRVAPLPPSINLPSSLKLRRTSRRINPFASALSAARCAEPKMPVLYSSRPAVYFLAGHRFGDYFFIPSTSRVSRSTMF
jgi:hypothetical protein